MRTVVLDKSVLKGATDGVLASYGEHFRYVLTDILFDEIVTEGGAENAADVAMRDASLRSMIDANLGRIVGETDNAWYFTRDALTYELETGRSARLSPQVTYGNLLEYRSVVRDETWNRIAEQERMHAQLMNLEGFEDAQARTIEDLATVQGRRAFFTMLADQLLDRPTLCVQCVKDWEDLASEHGIAICPGFALHESLLCYGSSLVSRAHWFWKCWARKERPADSAKPPNPFYDAVQIAYVAICDGLLAGDRGMLHMAWACWPNKREHLYTYDDVRLQIERFDPDWVRKS